jgi:predicted nucleic-acid-binding protein
VCDGTCASGMRAVDTNVLVRLITGDDPNQTEAAEEFVESGGWVSHLVVAEMTWVLSTVYRLSPEAIAGAIEMLLSHAHLTVQDADVVTAALDGYRRHARVDFFDHLVLEVARKAGHLPVGTFDRQFARLAGVDKI